jgi:hypothetical protein
MVYNPGYLIRRIPDHKSWVRRKKYFSDLKFRREIMLATDPKFFLNCARQTRAANEETTAQQKNRMVLNAVLKPFPAHH